MNPLSDLMELLTGTVNRNNCRIRGLEKPKETHERSQSSPKVNVWMGLSADQIYGPFFFEENINGEAYLNMLRTCFIPSLQPRTLSNCIFQQDGAPAHFARPVRQFLDETFPGRWLGRCGPLIWSARSPNLSAMDFFLWGHLKTQVYFKKTETIQQLKDAICEEAAKITREMCQNAIQEFKRRLARCLGVSGANVEHC